MNRIVRNIIQRLTEKPKTLFLIDSLGAIFTALFMIVALSSFSEYMGMSITTLTYLSLIATCFSIYSTTCFFFLKENWGVALRTIGIFNLLYCILTMGLILIYYPSLTIIGITYFLVEITIISGLSYIELQVAQNLIKYKPA